MKKNSRALWLGALATAAASGCVTDNPDASGADRAAASEAPPLPLIVLENARMRLSLGYPDGARALYRGQRFNRGGVIAEVIADGRRFFGPWKPDMPRDSHDAITGPADEFDIENPPGFEDADPDGGVFIKIGVGALRRNGPEKYRFWTTYPMASEGRWEVERTSDSVRYTQVLRTDVGYAYRLVKTIAPHPSAPEFTVTYTLANEGTLPISTLHYHHNFCVLEGVETVGPDWTVTFGYAPERISPEKPGDGTRLEGDTLRFLRPLEGPRAVWMSLSGADDPARHRLRVFHGPSAAGIEIVGDRPVEKMNVYAQFRAVCPEPFVRIRLEPETSESWSATYRFVGPAP